MQQIQNWCRLQGIDNAKLNIVLWIISLVHFCMLIYVKMLPFVYTSYWILFRVLYIPWNELLRFTG